MTTPVLPTDAFASFFRELHGYEPFAWQVRLATQVCQGHWPRYIKLPTASGKTSCVDVAVFALAYQACRAAISGEPIDAPRRIFFVVDRRIIVNEAYRLACEIRDRLVEALASGDATRPTYAVAWWLREMAGDQQAPPLDCFELRGGIYRDDAWVRSPLQPTVLTSTVDQIGSRLLFRGYGVSDRNLPIHAALTANDALVVLDEAHCSVPFSQTMEAIARYRCAPAWAEEAVETPFRFVEMTATPKVADAEVFGLTDQDYALTPTLVQRHGVSKPAVLLEVRASGQRYHATLAKALGEQALALANGTDGAPGCQRVAVVVNRVATARAVHAYLKNKGSIGVELMIGRMRPMDRDHLTTSLQRRFRSGAEVALEVPHVVVATQCLEVGADLDFDGMVSQCASLDALRQRFGRLNRLGQSAHARGVVAMAAGDVSPKQPDPIYDAALPATWDWLREQAEEDVVDFGVRPLDTRLATASASRRAALTAPTPDAPVLLPSHLDLLCQTAPRPAVEPDVAAFLHGPSRGVAEVSVCWRADLPDVPRDVSLPSLAEWGAQCETALAICPPASAECVSVPLGQLQRWLRGEPVGDVTGDVLGEAAQEAEPSSGANRRPVRPDEASWTPRHAVLWSGAGGGTVSGVVPATLANLRPNTTVVIPVSQGGWSALCHLPNAPEDIGRAESDDPIDLRALASLDLGSQAFTRARARTILRIHPGLMPTEAHREALHDLVDYLGDAERGWQHAALAPDEEVDARLSGGADRADPDIEFLRRARRALYGAPARDVRMQRYPGGIALIGPRRPPSERERPRETFDDERDEQNLDADGRLSLADHLADVEHETSGLAHRLGLPAHLAKALGIAAARHDLGKADPRFQAMLLGAAVDVAWMQPRLWAKSARGTYTDVAALKPSGLPTGWRHEMLSLEFAEHLSDDLTPAQRELMLHTIAAHHGNARPFAPVVTDPHPPAASLRGLIGQADANSLVISAEERAEAVPAHALSSGIANRFWRLTRRYGWWGLGWLESTLRLADWLASAYPLRSSTPAKIGAPIHRTVSAETRELALPGLSAANPLGFLAAMGTLRQVAQVEPEAGLSWRQAGTWHPVLVSDVVRSEEDLLELLCDRLDGREDEPQFVEFGKNITVPVNEFRAIATRAAQQAHTGERTFADFCAAFGTDALVAIDGVTAQDTALRTMAGAGHQHFVETMRNLIEACNVDHLSSALFAPWRYQDPTQTLSLRFDPLDDNRYALQWRNPSGDPDRKVRGSMLGANRLAIEAFPLFPTAPGPARLQTTAFTGHRANDTYFHWPIWCSPLPLAVVKSLLTLAETLENRHAAILRARGIPMVWRSQRITVGKVRNFTPAKPQVIEPSTDDARPPHAA